MSEQAKWQALVACFALKGEMASIAPYGSGHINDTYCVVMQETDRQCRYILQRMNDSIFTNPAELMENVVRVTTFLCEKIMAQGGDPERETLNVILARDGGSYVQDPATGPWRMYRFIEDATSFDKVEKPEDFYQSAVAFGQCWRIIRQRRFMRPFRIFTIHRCVWRILRRHWRRTCVAGQLRYRMRSVLFWTGKQIPMC